MKRCQVLVVGVFTLLSSVAGNCSRARVESMNKMNEGVIAAQQKRSVDAVKLLEQAAAIDPQNDQVFWNMAIVHMEMRKYDRARDDLQKAIAKRRSRSTAAPRAITRSSAPC
jgi:Tfp pilus assembly protein PilF